MALLNPSSPDLTDVKSRLDCRSIAEAVLGGPASRGTTWWLFRAPDRPDKHPSFGVRAERFTDFATGDAGDVFGLLMRLYNLTRFSEAITLAVDLAGGVTSPPPRRPRPLIVPQERSAPPPAAWQQAALAVVSQAEAYLWSDRPDAAKARQYLSRERGFTEETIERFRLGFNPRWTKTTWRKTDDGAYASLPPGIVIPCFAEGSLWYVKVRCIVGNLAAALNRRPEQLGDAESPKYLNLAGGNPGALFNADALADHTPVLLVEGEFDALLAHQLAADQVAAVTLGSASNTLIAHFRQKLQSAPLILLCLDNDGAGHDGAARLKTSLPGAVYPVTLPMGKDIGEYLIAHQGNLSAFIAQALATVQPPPARTPDTSFAARVPDTLRAALNAYCYPAIAPTLELWHEAIRAGLLTPTAPVTVKGLVAAAGSLGRATSIHTLKAGLREGAGQFWRVLQTGLSLEKEPDPGAATPLCKTPLNSPRPGRTPISYRLLPPDIQRENLLALAAPRILEKHFPIDDPTIAPVRAEFLVALGYAPAEAEQLSQVLADQYRDLMAAQPGLQSKLDQARLAYKRLARDIEKPKNTPFPSGWTYRNAAEYVGVFARALAEANPTMQQSRTQLARTLGKGARSVDAILKRAGITNERQEAARPITSVAEYGALEAAYDPTMKGYPVRVVSIRGEKTMRERRFDPEQREFVAHELAAGAQVVVRYQQASRQVIATLNQPPPKLRQVIAAVNQPPDETQRQPKPPVCGRYCGVGFNPVWCATWTIKLLERATRWQVQGEVICHQDTGELVGYSPRQVVELLLDPERGTDTPPMDELLAELVAGGVITEIEHRGGVT